jgi:ABC-type branched-subunit amino acid transport system substrate-binding protein
LPEAVYLCRVFSGKNLRMAKLLRYCLIGCLMCTVLQVAHAQSLQEFTNSFQLGRKLIDEKNYTAAQSTLANVLKDVPQNPYYKHAVYLYALADYHTGEFARCRETLVNFLNRYPAWEQADEVRLLAALAALAANDPNVANAMGSALKDSQLRKVFDNARLAYQQKNGGSAANSTPVNNRPVVTKKTYHVAVMLPFMLSETDATKPGRRFQFVYDMYEGMKIAQEDLAKEGVDIQLYPFDTERNNAVIRRKLEEQKGLDLLIGPLYANNVEPMGAYAAQHNISIVNPFGTGAELLKNAHTLLAEPSPVAMAQQAAAFAAAQLPGKTAIIYHGNTSEDSLMAYAYKQAHERNNGRTHIIRSLNPKMNFQRIISELDAAPRSDSTHIFICARQPAVAVSVVSALLSSKRVLPAITTQDWLNYDLLSYEQLQLARMHFIMPDFVRETPAKTRFDKLIVERTNMVPSKFSYIGYESVYFFGKMLHKYGVNFQQFLAQESPAEGIMMPGFDFRNGRENIRAAICTFNGGVFQQVFPLAK